MAEQVGEVGMDDLATLDVDATVGEVMTAVHWVEDHIPGLVTNPQSDPDPTTTSPIKAVRRGSSVVLAIPPDLTVKGAAGAETARQLLVHQAVEYMGWHLRSLHLKHFRRSLARLMI